MVCHVLLVETDNGLVLVDTGYGSQTATTPRADRAHTPPLQAGVGPRRNGGPPGRATWFQPRQTFATSSSHISTWITSAASPTFPDAQIHVTAAEVLGAVREPSCRERVRFRPAQWAHGPSSSSTIPTGRSGEGSQPPRNSTTSRRESCWCRCPATREGTRVSLSTPATAGCCTAGTRSTTRAQLDGQSRVPRTHQLWSRCSRSTESGCTTTTPASPSCTSAANPTC